MSKPNSIILTDLHLNEDNWEQVSLCCFQARDYCVDHSISLIIFAGDIFDSRKALSLPVLMAFKTIIDVFKAANEYMRIVAIPGNHDKPSYKSRDSYLDMFSGMIEVKRDVEWIAHISTTYHFLPFFEKDYLSQAIPKLVHLQKKGKFTHLIAHIGFQGARMNTGIYDQDGTDINLGELYTNVFCGHYHDRHTIEGTNIHYIGSLIQHTFGEEPYNKGFTVVYGNGTYDYVDVDFRRKIKLYIDEEALQDVQGYLDIVEIDATQHDVRLILDTSAVSTLDISTIQKIESEFNVNIHVDKKIDEIEVVEQAMIVTQLKNDSSALVQLFTDFCEQHDISEDNKNKIIPLLI